MRAPRIAAAVIVLGVAGLCAATVASLLAPLGWPFELFSHFRIQCFVGGAVLAFCALLLSQRALATAAITASLLNSFNPDALGAVRTATAQSACQGPRITLVTANLYFHNDEHQRVLDWLGSHPADVVLLEEVTSAWADSLVHLPGYTHRAIRAREDPYGMALLAAQAPESVSWLDLADDGMPAVGAEFEIQGRPLRIIGLHTRSPLQPDSWRARDRSLERAAERSSYGDQPTIVLGDLNLSPDSPWFSRLLEAGHLVDTMAGEGWRPTWLANVWPLALRIDHVLASPGLCVVETEVGPDIGSDHRPVRVTLRMRR